MDRMRPGESGSVEAEKAQAMEPATKIVGRANIIQDGWSRSEKLNDAVCDDARNMLLGIDCCFLSRKHVAPGSLCGSPEYAARTAWDDARFSLEGYRQTRTTESSAREQSCITILCHD